MTFTDVTTPVSYAPTLQNTRCIWNHRSTSYLHCVSKKRPTFLSATTLFCRNRHSQNLSSKNRDSWEL